MLSLPSLCASAICHNVNKGLNALHAKVIKNLKVKGSGVPMLELGFVQNQFGKLSSWLCKLFF